MSGEGGPSFESFETRHSPEKDRARIEYAPDEGLHVSDVNLCWYNSVLAGTALYDMYHQMQADIERHLTACTRRCQRRARALQEIRFISMEEILSGKLKNSIR